jgi:hypothetical protein
MGCDYYTQKYYVFSYKSSEGKEETFDEPVGERESWYIGYYDEDVQTRAEAEEAQKEALGFNEVKVLYEGGKWLCTAICKENLEKIMDRHPGKEVFKIVKMTIMWDR